MKDAEFEALRDDIKANGLLDPIMMYEDKILDGRTLRAKRERSRLIFGCIPMRSGEPAGSSQIGFIRFFEPFEHLRLGYRPFWQMRIERARPDIWRVDQFRSREFLGLSLVRKSFGRPYAPSFSPWQFS